MDECLQILDKTKECLNDEILVQQVRLQLIVEKMAQGTLHDGAIGSTDHKRPTELYLEGLHSQLQSIKTSLVTRSQKNGKLPGNN